MCKVIKGENRVVEASAKSSGDQKMLKRGMKMRDLYFAGLTAVIGSGWLFGGYLTASVAGPASIISWIIGGIFILIIALVWSEIATAVPIAGGAARYANFTHGGVAASIIAWSTILTYIAVPAVEAVAVISILQGALTYYGVTGVLLMNASGMPSVYGVAIAAAFSGAFFYVNYIGLKGLIKTNFGMTIWKLIIPPIAVILLLIFGLSKGFGTNFLSYGFVYQNNYGAIFSAIPATGVVFAYLGFRQPVEMAAEAKSPGRDIWRALVAVTLTGMGIYILLEIAFLGALGWNSNTFGTAGVLAGQYGNLSTTLPMYSFPYFYEAMGLGLGSLGIVLIIDGVVSPTGTLSQYMGSTARVIYGTAKEGYLSSSFFNVHEKHRVPTLGIIVTFIVTVALLIIAGVGYLVSSVGGAWSALVSIVTTTGVFSYIIGPIALMSFRKSHPNLKRPFALPYYQVFALVAFVVSSLMVYWGAGSLNTPTDPYGGYILLVIILAGLVLYTYAKGRNLMNDIKTGSWVVVFLLFNILLLYLGEYGINALYMPIDWIVDIIAAIVFFFWATKTTISDKEMIDKIDQSINMTEGTVD